MAPVETIQVPLGLEDDCAACAKRLETGLRDHRGIDSIEPAPSGTALVVRYDPDLCSLACLTDTAERLRIDLSHRFDHEVLRVSGMDCYDCAQTIERAVCRMPGVSSATVNFPAARMRVEYERGTVELSRLKEIVEGLGYQVTSPDRAEPAAPRPWWRRRELLTGAAAALTLVALLVDLAADMSTAARVLYGAAIVIGGWPVARSGIAALRRTRRPDINFLMTIAVVGAVAIDAWLEAALVVVLFSLGEVLEGRAVERARRELAGLVALTPETARVRRSHVHPDGKAHTEEVETSVSDLVVGDLVVVRPGERIAADGLVSEGASAVDQAPITGESTPVDKTAGDPVFAGTLNAQGLLVVQVGSAPGDMTLDKIGRLVEEAQSLKSPSERWVDRFARV